MKSSQLFLVVFFLLATSSLIKGQTFQTNGDWNTASNWNPASVPSGTGTNVTISANPTISSPNSNTIGNVSVGNNQTVTVSSGGSLTLGSQTLFDANTKKSMTFSNSGTLTVGGTLYIYGDLIVNNSLTLNITGTMIVYGNITMSNGGDLTVSGSGTLQVGGNIAGGNGTHIATTGTGTIAVTGSISTGGGGSTITGSNGSITAGSCNINGASCGTTVTPVTLIFFKASKKESQVKLNWATATELNFDYFDIERSQNGTNFVSIGKVDGHGTTNEVHEYQFVDELPFVGKNYYRLKSVDYDLYSEYFKVISVDFAGDKQIQFSPNPSDGNSIAARINFVPSENASVIVYDNVGSVVGRFALTGNESGFTFSNQLKAGVYYAKFSSDGFTKVSRFLVKE